MVIEKEIVEVEVKVRKEVEKKVFFVLKSIIGFIVSKIISIVIIVKKEVVFIDIKENIVVGKSFEFNCGKLFWLVVKGLIMENYGKNVYLILLNVYINNNGIDIGVFKNL